MCALRLPVTLKAKALQLLAMREYSRAEMEGKLQQWLRTQAAKAADLAAAKDADTIPATEIDAMIAADAAERSAASMEPQQGQIAAVLDALQAKGFLSDQRAAEALLHRKGGKFGTARLRHELQRKGIDADVARDCLQDMAASDLERARALWQKKFGVLPATPAERARQMRFLAGRGFGADIIQRVMRQGTEDVG
ncbi:MAG: regulatory protein RecX [Brachymonas sp.]